MKIHGKDIVLRREQPEDYFTVEKLTYEAFKNAEHASGDKALLVHKLRTETFKSLLRLLTK